MNRRTSAAFMRISCKTSPVCRVNIPMRLPASVKFLVTTADPKAPSAAPGGFAEPSTSRAVRTSRIPDPHGWLAGRLTTAIILQLLVAIISGPTCRGQGTPGVPDLSAAEPTHFYEADFETAAGAEWSTPTLNRTPVGGRGFLGRFGNEKVSLNLTRLPVHTNLVLSFDLLIVQTWDGNASPGPDIWELERGDDASLLLHTTFSNFRSNGRHQSFPENHPAGRHLAQSGASEVNTLGYDSGDAVYHLQFEFPHQTADLSLNFSAQGLQGLNDESWGLDNVRLSSGSPPQVRLLRPAPEAAASSPGDIVIEASAESSDSEITKVQFLANGVVLGETDRPPYQMVWANPPPGVHPLTVRAFDAHGLSDVAVATFTVNGLRGEYFNAPDLSALKATRQDPRIDFSWADRLPVPVVLSDLAYGVRWTGFVTPEFSQDYRLSLRVDDAGRLWIDGRRVIDAWQAQRATTYQAVVPLEAGRRHLIQIDYNNTACCGAEAHLSWESQSQAAEIIPQTRLWPFDEATNFPPNRPVFVEPSVPAQWMDPRQLTLAVDLFSDPNSGDTHAASDWEIWSVEPPERVWSAANATGTTRLRVTPGQGRFEGAQAGRWRLKGGAKYVARTRHQDAHGVGASAWSEWAELDFQTLDDDLLLGGAEWEVQVPAWSDLWLAGMPDGSRASTTDVAPDQAPALASIPTLVPGSGLAFQVTGNARNGASEPYAGPSGGSNTSHRGGAENGVSGFSGPINALIGVFLSSERPDISAPPADANFNTAASRNFSSLSPALKQVFYIGDGRNAEGNLQTFVVPAGATRLFLGTMDGFQWLGNGGVFSVVITELSWRSEDNLVANANFEEPGFDASPGYRYLDNADSRISHWTATDDGQGERSYWNKLTHLPARVYDGLYSVVLNQGTQISTTIPVKRGATYEVSFQSKAILDSERPVSPLEVVAGDHVFAFEPTATWTRRRFLVVAPSTTSEWPLIFRNPSPEGDYRLYAIDAISVFETSTETLAASLRAVQSGVLAIQAPTGSHWELEFRPTLDSADPWRVLGTVQIRSSPQNIPVDPFTTGPSGFFRAKTIP